MLPNSTVVTYPNGTLEGRARVLAVHPMDERRVGVVTEATPFHPRDHAWPDQPGDHGELHSEGAAYAVEDCLTAARNEDGELFVGGDIPVRPGTEGWAWLVLHVVPAPGPAVGAPAELRVDAERRAALSAGHTGCHLMALALNAALADRWRGDVRADSLWHPDFDRLAISSSVIKPDGAIDRYRIGRSLRKAGFVAGDLNAELPEITERVNARLAVWTSTGAPVMIDRDGPLLCDRRYWTCALPEGRAVLPCGGTHLRNVAQLTELTCALTLNADGTGLTVRTSAARTVTGHLAAQRH